MRLRTATTAAALATAAAFTYLAFFLFGPVYMTCGMSIHPGEAPVADACRQVRWLQVESAGGRGSPPDLRPIFFLTLWTLAPLVALAGVRLRAGGLRSGILLVVVGLLIELSSVVSIGGGFIYALLCGPLLLVALIASLRSPPATAG